MHASGWTNVDMLQPCGHLLGKGWPIGSLVCDVFLCFCHFPVIMVLCVRRGI